MSLLPSRGPETSTSQDGELQIVGVDEDISSVLDALSSETARDILNAVYEEPGTPSELAERLDMSIQKVSYHLEKLEEQELIAIAGTQYSEKGQEMTVYEPPDDPLVVFVGTPDRKRTLRSLIERLVPAVGLLTAASVMVQAVFGTLPGLVGSPGSDASEPAADDVGAANDTGGASDSGAGNDTGDYQAREQNGTDGESVTTNADQPPETDGGMEATTNETTETTGNGTEIDLTDEAPTETPTPEPSPPESSTPIETVQEVTETATTAATGGGVDLEPGVAFFLGGLLVVGVVGLTWAYTN